MIYDSTVSGHSAVANANCTGHLVLLLRMQVHLEKFEVYVPV